MGSRKNDGTTRLPQWLVKSFGRFIFVGEEGHDLVEAAELEGFEDVAGHRTDAHGGVAGLRKFLKLEDLAEHLAAELLHPAEVEDDDLGAITPHGRLDLLADAAHVARLKDVLADEVDDQMPAGDLDLRSPAEESHPFLRYRVDSVDSRAAELEDYKYSELEERTEAFGFQGSAITYQQRPGHLVLGYKIGDT